MKKKLGWLINLLKFIFRDLLNDGWRSAITIANLLLFLCCYFCLASLAQAANQFGKTDRNDNHLMVVSKAVVDPLESQITLAQFDPINELMPDQVQAVSPLIFRLMKIEDYLIQVRATSLEDMQNVFQLKLTEGKWPVNLNEIVIGENTVLLTKWQVGQTIKVYGKEFLIAGIINSPGTKSSAIWMNMDAGEKLFNTHDVYQFAWIVVADGVDSDHVKEILQNDPRLSQDFDIYYVDHLYAQYADSLEDINQICRILEILSLVLVMFGTYGSIFLTLSERSREITILRAIGFSANTIKMILAIRTFIQIVIAYLGSWGISALLLDRIGKNTPLTIRAITVDLSITGSILAWGILLALLFGGLGILIPTINLKKTSVNIAIHQ